MTETATIDSAPTSTFVRHIPCPDCGSRDNNALYSDGSTHCFGCGSHPRAITHNVGSYAPMPTSCNNPTGLIENTEIAPIHSRKITPATARTFRYTKAIYKGQPVQVAPYYDADGQLVAQKIRWADKTFAWLGNPKKALPFGSEAWPRSGRKIIVTEGELDALAMSQAQNNKYPVVSIACGAGPQVAKYMAQHRDYFMGFEQVVIMFDNDPPGREAAKVAAKIIGGSAYIATLPMKDASDMVLHGREEELIRCMWGAAQYRPEGIVDMTSLKDAVKEPPKYGLSWPWPSLTALTYGIPERAVVAIGGAGGGGKTDITAQVIQHLITEHKESVGVFSLEQHVVETATRLAGKLAGKTFHVPDSGWTDDDKDRAWEALMEGGRVYLYDSFGVNAWSAVKEKIEFLRHNAGVRYFFIDNMTALAAAEESEKEAIESILADMGSLVQRLDCTLIVIGHLATPEGRPHEEGGRVMGRHFKGSRAWLFWSYLMLGLERNQQAQDHQKRNTTRVRVLKERKTGRGVGECLHLLYDRATGLLHECAEPADDSTIMDEFQDAAF